MSQALFQPAVRGRYTTPSITPNVHDDKHFRMWARNVEREMAAALLAETPTPEQMAMRLPLVVVDALTTALPKRDGYAVSRCCAQIIMPWGLCEAGTKKQWYFLSNFGRAVLLHIKADFA